MDQSRITQIFSLHGPKIRVVNNAGPAGFRIFSLTGSLVYQGELSAPLLWNADQQESRFADWSSVAVEGIYRLEILGYGISEFFHVDADLWKEVGTTLLRGFYFQRASLELTAPHAGIFARSLGHADSEVYVHASAASEHRPEGFAISAPKGWYDAGDYNKYIVNSAISVWTLLTIFRMKPSILSAISCNIPESNEKLPDILAEVRWNLDWMLCMQDPHDGGVYHKLTNLRFDPFRMPAECTEPRFVVQKTTAASLDFAASMAHAARVYRDYDTTFSHQCLEQARMAYSWAQRNPDTIYAQPIDVGTGRYGDEVLNDEFQWAAWELFLSTGDLAYQEDAVRYTDLVYGVPNWQSVATLGQISIALEAKDQKAQTHIVDLADHLLALQRTNAYNCSMQAEDFIWGSNAVAANQGMILLVAHHLHNENTPYLHGAAHMLNYLLGTNPLQRSFITGVGTQSPMNPHHRISAADGIAEPVPGLLVGGPNAGMHDRRSGIIYPSSIPALCYLDEQGSYASNEIAINWNAPAVFLALGLFANST